MLNSLKLSMLGSISQEDRDACEPMVEHLLELLDFARRYGLFALEKYIDKESNTVLRTALMMIIDGADDKLTESVLCNLILSSGAAGAVLLEQFLITEGIYHIQNGSHPRVMHYILGSMLGTSYINKIQKFTTETKQ